MNRWFFIGLLFSCWSLTSQEVDSLYVQIDSTSIEVLQFSKDFSQSYSGGDFNYEDSVEGNAENFIARWINWFFNKIGELFGVQLSPETLKFLELTTYILLILFAIKLIAKLLSGHDIGTLFSKKNSVMTRFNVRDEHIEQIDFDALISEAMVQNNYRLAVRYQFLKLLKELSIQGYIEWHHEKTNSDYYSEIGEEKIRKGFKEVSYLYNYVWYGEFALDEPAFENATLLFERLTNSLTHVE